MMLIHEMHVFELGIDMNVCDRHSFRHLVHVYVISLLPIVSGVFFLHNLLGSASKFTIQVSSVLVSFNMP